MFGIKVPAADEAMIISGAKGGDDGTPFKVVIGQKAFVPPVIRNVSFLTLAMQEAEVSEKCVTQKGISLLVNAVIAFKVKNDTPSIVNAAQRFLTDQRQMPVLTGRIFAGHLRSIVGSMTVEEIIRERQRLATEVLDASKEEMAKLGLLVDSLQISSIDDMGTGYVEALAAPQKAAVRQAALIAQAEADRAATEAQQRSEQKQAEYTRLTAEVHSQQNTLQQQAQAKAESETQIVTAAANAAAIEAQQESETRQAQARAETAVAVAKNKASIDAEQAKAAQAGPLAEAQAQQATLSEQAKAAEVNAALREAQLIAEVIRPAEADAKAKQIAAQASAKATELQAQAAASSNRVALDQMLIQQLPEIVKNAASGIAGSNLTILNGADGLSDVVSGLMSQGLRIYQSVRDSNLFDSNGQSHDDEGERTKLPSGSIIRR